MQEKSTYITPLSDATAGLAEVGGKGASLVRLTNAGFPVPPGFCVTTTAYRKFVGEHSLQEQILALVSAADPDRPETVEAASRQIGALFAQKAVPDEIFEEIRRAYAGLGEGQTPVAVAARSSATAEDLPEASFAGQQETYLNVRGVDPLLDAIKRCWASLWTSRAIAYRARHAITHESVAMAVVVQTLVEADAAGVMFTANPVTGCRGEVIITAAWGLGEAVVSGAVTPDTITLDKGTGRIIRRETADKRVMTVRTSSGTQEEPVLDSLKLKEVLSDEQAAQLSRLGAGVEDLYGAPVDIEWAAAGGKFAVLQARPITALPSGGGEAPLEWRLSSPYGVGVRVSFTEFLPDAVPPLVSTLAIPIISEFTAKLMKRVMGERGERGYYFEVVNGYAFSCIDTRQIFTYLVSIFGATKKILKYGKERLREVQDKIRAVTRKWQQTDITSIPAVELVAGARELFSQTADYFTVAQSGPIPDSTTSETFFRAFYNMLVKRKTDPPSTAFLVGLGNLALRAEMSLYDLAQWAKGQAGLADYLLRTPADTIRDALNAGEVPAPLAGEFASRFAAYLADFGHATYDLDFSKSAAADDPQPVLQTLKLYLSGQGYNPHARLETQADKRRQAEQAISERLNPLRRKWFNRLLRSAQERAPGRENAIADLGLPYPQIQRILRELGRRLATGGAVLRPGDIFWLEAAELDEMASRLDRKEPLPSLAASVKMRKSDGQRFQHAIPPVGIPKNHWFVRMAGGKEKTSGNKLKGIGASAGQVTAPACILRRVEDFSQMRPGDVLVAVTTTPAWTPLFAMASAVVTDIGGPLSHSSIVAREYGIPAVMATGLATRLIRTGQVITVDGSAGTVSIKD